MTEVAILTIDGPGGSGKGTVSLKLANHLGWHYLDSGANYRILAWTAREKKIDLENTQALVDLVAAIKTDFNFNSANKNYDDKIRTETIAHDASKIATLDEVRQAMLSWQRGCARLPGLVAEGRDMGTVVFPQSKCKIYLTASAKVRAKRRFKQLSSKDYHVKIDQLCAEIIERDLRDSRRLVSPLRPAHGAIQLDTTHLDINQVVSRILKLVVMCYPTGKRMA